MKVFFTASYKGKKTHQQSYDRIVKTLQDSDLEVISLEIQKYEDLLGQEILCKRPINEVHALYIKKGIDLANAVVIEASRDNFQIGHEATLSLLYNKPVLCLSDNKDYSEKILHPKFYAKIYNNLEEIDKHIADFIDEVKNKFYSVRFQILLSPEQKNFLMRYGAKNKLNKSEVLRKMIDEKMKEDNGIDLYSIF
jgi:hypothetical protein